LRVCVINSIFSNKQVAENLDIRCRFILQTSKSKNSKKDEINEAIEFVKSFSQETISFDDPLVLQQSERQVRSLG
jgi:hypothetical protein